MRHASILLLATFLVFQTVFSVQTSCPCKCSNGHNGMNGKDGRDGRDGRDGKDGAKGIQGPPGPMGTLQGGAIKIGDTSAACTRENAGTIRFAKSHNTLQLCNGNMWTSLMPTGKGTIKTRPGLHCLDILNSGYSHGDDFYWIDPNGGSTDDAFQAYCDMTTQGGGWTLVSTKVTPSFISIKSGFSTQAARETNINAASQIHPSMTDWTEVMFRFSDSGKIRVIYKKACSGGTGAEFEKFLMGSKYNRAIDVNGFYKYSPSTGNKRQPSSSCYTIKSLHYYSKQGISESHGGTDKWLDMWHSAEGSNNYHYHDNAAALGTKCIAGYCYLNKPIWVMVR